MPAMEFWFEFDKHGVGDGQKMAGELIDRAYRLLLPYVGGQCHVAADLMTAIAAEKVKAAMEEADEEQQMDGIVAIDDEVDPETAIVNHLNDKATQTMTRLQTVHNARSGKHLN